MQRNAHRHRTAESSLSNAPPERASPENASNPMERRFLLKDASEFEDGSGMAVRFHEHPPRYVLQSQHPDYTGLAALLRSLVGKEATFLLDWTHPKIVGIHTPLCAI